MKTQPDIAGTKRVMIEKTGVTSKAFNSLQ